MKSVSGKDFARILERHGWELLRIKGSHHHYGKTGVEEIISIPVHGNKQLGTGLQRFFMRIANLKEEDL